MDYIQLNLKVCIEDIIINTIVIKDDCRYKMLFKIHNDLYSITHFEPLVVERDVQYGHGPYYVIKKIETIDFT